MKELTMQLKFAVVERNSNKQKTTHMTYLLTLRCCLFVEEFAGSFLSAGFDVKVKCVQLCSEEFLETFDESVAMAMDPELQFKLMLGSVGAKEEVYDSVTLAWTARGSNGSESPAGSESQKGASSSSDDEGEDDEDEDEDEDGKSDADSSDGYGSDQDEDDGHDCGGDDDDDDPPSSGGEPDDEGPEDPDDESGSDSDGSS